MSAEHYDLVGVGIGPSNLSLAALAEPIPGLRTLFLDDRERFTWHPGVMVGGSTLQVPFLADLVTLVDPTSRHSYLAYLRDRGRLFGFYFARQWHVPRIEYEDYCRSVADSLPSCRFGCQVTAVRHAVLADGADGFEVCFTAPGGAARTVLAANVVLAIGTEPVVPGALRELCEEAGPLLAHSAHYTARAAQIQAADDISVLGSGQSGAEIVLDLLRTWHRPGRRLRWLTRSAAFGPTQYSKIGLEHLTPDYTDHFHALPEARRDTLVAGQARPAKAVAADTLAAIRAQLDALAFPGGVANTGVTLMPGVEAVAGAGEAGRILLSMRHTDTGRRFTVHTRRLVLATGYAPRAPRCLEPIAALIERDRRGRFVIERGNRIRLVDSDAGLYIQNGETHTHGVAGTGLGLGAHRAAAIVNAVVGPPVYDLPRRTAHTAFTPETAAAADPGITVEPAVPAAAASVPPSAATGRHPTPTGARP